MNNIERKLSPLKKNFASVENSRKCNSSIRSCKYKAKSPCRAEQRPITICHDASADISIEKNVIEPTYSLSYNGEQTPTYSRIEMYYQRPDPQTTPLLHPTGDASSRDKNLQLQLLNVPKKSTTAVSQRSTKLRLATSNPSTVRIVTSKLKLGHPKTGTEIMKKYEETSKELLLEKQKRTDLEVMTHKLKKAIEKNQEEMKELIETKHAVLKLAVNLRQKYDTIRQSRLDTLKKVSEMKQLNAELMRKLEEEIKFREAAVENAKRVYNSISEEKPTSSHRHCKVTEQQLLSSNEELLNNLQQTSKTLTTTQQERERLLKALENTRERVKHAQDEINRLNTKCHEAQKEIDETRRARERLEKRATELENELNGAQEAHGKKYEKVCTLNTELRMKLRNSAREQGSLRCQCERLEAQLKAYEKEDEEKAKIIQQELTKFTKYMTNKEKTLLKEKNEIRKLVSDLYTLVKKHSERINKLMQTNKEQEKQIKYQQKLIDDKDSEILSLSNDLKQTRLRVQQLEKEVKNMYKKTRSSTIADKPLKKISFQTIMAPKKFDEKTESQQELERRARSPIKKAKPGKKETPTEDKIQDIEKLRIDITSHNNDLLNIRQVLMNDVSCCVIENPKKKTTSETSGEVSPRSKLSEAILKQREMLANLDEQIRQSQREWEKHTRASKRDVSPSKDSTISDKKLKCQKPSKSQVESSKNRNKSKIINTLYEIEELKIKQNFSSDSNTTDDSDQLIRRELTNKLKNIKTVCSTIISHIKPSTFDLI